MATKTTREEVSGRLYAALPRSNRKTWYTALQIAHLAGLQGSRSVHPALERLAKLGKIRRRKNHYGRWEYAR